MATSAFIPRRRWWSCPQQCYLHCPPYQNKHHAHKHTHTHTRLTALCPWLPRWVSTRKRKPIWILLEQETASGRGINWAICKSAPRSKQITMPAPHHSVFTGRMPFLPPNQQRLSTEGTNITLSMQSKINSKSMASWSQFLGPVMHPSMSTQQLAASTNTWKTIFPVFFPSVTFSSDYHCRSSLF